MPGVPRIQHRRMYDTEVGDSTTKTGRQVKENIVLHELTVSELHECAQQETQVVTSVLQPQGESHVL